VRPIQSAFLRVVLRTMFLSHFIHCNTSSFFTLSVILFSSPQLRYFWPLRSVQASASLLYVHYRYYIYSIVDYRGCPRRNVQNFGGVFLMLNYTDITQNTYVQSWTVTEIMAIEKCGLLECPRTVRRRWRHIRPVRMPGNETPLANIVMQWPWRDNATAAGCVNYLET